jgi:hypothetical protein
MIKKTIKQQLKIKAYFLQTLGFKLEAPFGAINPAVPTDSVCNFLHAFFFIYHESEPIIFNNFPCGIVTSNCNCLKLCRGYILIFAGERKIVIQKCCINT